MPDAKISQLTALTTAVSADLLPIVDTTANPDETKKITLGNTISSGLATITGLTASTSLTTDDLVPVVDDPAGTPAAKKITYQNFLNSLTALTALSSTSSDDIVLIVDDPGGTPTAKKITVANLITPSGLVLLEQHTASASASLNFTTCLTSTYDTYVIECVSIVPATDNVSFNMRVSTNGGSSYDSGANYQYSFFYFSSVASGSGGSAGTTTFLVAGTGVDNASTTSVNGSIRLYDPLNATAYKTANASLAFFGNDGNLYRLESALRYLSATAVNAFQFYFSSGNIASGTIRVYGVSK